MDFIYKDNYKHSKIKRLQQKGINSSYLMLCATLSFFLTLSSIASTNGDLLGFIFLSLLPIKNPQNKYKTKIEKLLLYRNPIFITIAIPFFEPLDHLIATCPLSIQKMERTGEEERDPNSIHKLIPYSLYLVYHLLIIFYMNKSFFDFFFQSQIPFIK